MEIKKKHVEYLYMVLFMVFVVIIIMMNTTSVFSYNMVVIDNADANSMYPTYTQSDIFIVKNNGPETIVLGDVIVYHSPSGKNVIHRVIDVVVLDETYFYRVKGDNPRTNYIPDNPNFNSLINYDDVMGKIVLRIPQIGHFSLAIQNNPLIRTLTLVAVVILSLTIIVWPENKEEEEEEKIEVSRATFMNYLKKQYIEPIQWYFGSDRLNRILLLLFMLLLVLSPMMITTYAPVEGEQRATGVYELSFDKSYTNDDKLNGIQNKYVFVQVWVKAYDAAGIVENINEIRVLVFRDAAMTSEISHTIWNSLRDMRGYFTFGGSVVIHQEDLPISGSMVYVKVEYDVRSWFTTTTQSLETSFNLTYTN